MKPRDIAKETGIAEAKVRGILNKMSFPLAGRGGWTREQYERALQMVRDSGAKKLRGRPGRVKSEETPAVVTPSRKVMVGIVSFQAEVCCNQNILSQRHLRTGDLFFSVPDGEEDSKAVCFVCAENQGMSGRAAKASKSKNYLGKRHRMLMKWAEVRKDGLKLTRSWTQRELDAAMDRIRFQTTEQTWDQRMEEIRTERKIWKLS